MQVWVQYKKVTTFRRRLLIEEDYTIGKVFQISSMVCDVNMNKKLIPY